MSNFFGIKESVLTFIAAVAMTCIAATEANSKSYEENIPVDIRPTEVAPSFTVEPTFRIHLDYATHRPDETELDDRLHFRRLWLGAKGKAGKNWNYYMLLSLRQDGTLSPIFAYMRYNAGKYGQLTLGYDKQQLGLDWIINSNFITMIERPLPVSGFSELFYLGAQYRLTGNNWTFQTLVFGQDRKMASYLNSENLSYGCRFTFAPYNNEGKIAHLGVSAYRERPPDRENRRARFTTRPESSPTIGRFADTETIEDVNSISKAGIETVLQASSLSLQGEWIYAGIKSGPQETNHAFSGWYTTLSWFVTGESRNYRNGTFQQTKPLKDSGAWELAARYSTVNLNDNLVSGGKQSNWTIGVNWYANDHMRFMLNVIKVNSERNGINDNPWIFLTRAQFAI